MTSHTETGEIVSFGLIKVQACLAPPIFGRSVNPIADYAYEIILAPPNFQTFRRPWSSLLQGAVFWWAHRIVSPI